MDASLRMRDRLQIEAALHRYARGVDRKDWDLFRSAYHPDAHDDHGDIRGDIDSLVRAIEERHATVKQSMHVLHAVIIEFAGDDLAVVETQFTVVQTLGPEADAYRRTLTREPLSEADDLQIRVYGRYVDRVTRRRDDWRIANRTVVIEQSLVSRSASAVRDGWNLASRDGNDPIERLRRETGLAGLGPLV